MFPYTFKPKFWPAVVTIPLLICMVLLGNWQIKRLEWKLGLIDQIETRAFMPPISLPFNVSDLENLEYLSVSVEGIFNNNQEMTKYSVGPNGEAGYDLYTPLVSTDGKVIIVNRGWVPEALKEQTERPQTLLENEVLVEGLLRKPSKKLWYGPENEPENNYWFYGDLDGMARAKNIDEVYPMYLFASGDKGDRRFPVAGRTEFNIVNNHLDYVLTWFGLAIVLVVIYIVAHTHRKEQ